MIAHVEFGCKKDGFPAKIAAKPQQKRLISKGCILTISLGIPYNKLKETFDKMCERNNKEEQNDSINFGIVCGVDCSRCGGMFIDSRNGVDFLYWRIHESAARHRVYYLGQR